jgi:hypothetical protein
MDDAADDVCAALAEERQLPKGWSLNEIDGTGARWVAIFRVAGVPRVEDGERVVLRIKTLAGAKKKAARSAIAIEPVLASRERENTTGRAWNLTTPTGWCFEPGRHTEIVKRDYAEAQRAKRTLAIEECPPGCECRLEGDDE